MWSQLAPITIFWPSWKRRGCALKKKRGFVKKRKEFDDKNALMTDVEKVCDS
jgi:hypothetical protein